ncbi:MAG: ribonuclease HII [Alphaproteobacteria bacterium]|nr:ribonuclease HII [Alphaproteobacteria bacterium]
MKRQRPKPDFSLEARGPAPVAGVDEAGRGPLAGPVIAAAVVFAETKLPDELVGIDDSKTLSPSRREELFSALCRLRDAGGVAIGVGRAEVAEIDAINILQASLKAMSRAVDDLGLTPGFVLVDGNRLPDLGVPAEPVVKGDGRSFSIAAASIVAKVTRDREMAHLDAAHPGYGWAGNAGYPTPAHLDALARLGPTDHHRRSFAPVRARLNAAD